LALGSVDRRGGLPVKEAKSESSLSGSAILAEAVRFFKGWSGVEEKKALRRREFREPDRIEERQPTGGEKSCRERVRVAGVKDAMHNSNHRITHRYNPPAAGVNEILGWRGKSRDDGAC
jgi:hypothetical protein